jgi:RNA 2',3'-cyclic 3'-phosphodiesterase
MALRCFVAVGIPGPLKEAVAGAIEALKKCGADVRWVAVENVHLTLKFLGETDESMVVRISDALSERLSSYSPFCINISGVGCFPDIRRPRVIWVGIEESPALKKLAGEVESLLADFGYPADDRAFSPHLTIGRVRSPKGIRGMMKDLEKLAAYSFGAMEIESVSLMKSELRPAGAEYGSLAEIHFGGRSNVEQG